MPMAGLPEQRKRNRYDGSAAPRRRRNDDARGGTLRRLTAAARVPPKAVGVRQVSHHRLGMGGGWGRAANGPLSASPPRHRQASRAHVIATRYFFRRYL